MKESLSLDARWRRRPREFASRDVIRARHAKQQKPEERPGGESRGEPEERGCRRSVSGPAGVPARSDRDPAIKGPKGEWNAKTSSRPGRDAIGISVYTLAPRRGDRIRRDAAERRRDDAGKTREDERGRIRM